MQLIITKFKRHENLNVPIPAEIRGGNEKGKSTIIEAISFCLTGKDLQGNEFKQIYDNRVDLHEAIADVTFIDNYGNKFRRVVKPVFKTDKKGKEYLFSKCSTKCSKNGIDCNDFADEFTDFLKFGTDYFFTKRAGIDLEQMQRGIFIDILKSKMPNYDVKEASLKLKELKKSQKTEVESVKSKQEQLKAVKDVEVSTIDPEILRLNAEYVKLSEVDNSAAISEVNRRNNANAESHSKIKKQFSEAVDSAERELKNKKESISELETKIKTAELSQFIPKPEVVDDFDLKTYAELKVKFVCAFFYEKLEDYASIYFHKNPVLVANAEKMQVISERQFVEPTEISGACPLSGDFCETAKLHSVASARKAFELTNSSEIEAIRAENRTILTKEMSEHNSAYLTLKSGLDFMEKSLQRINDENEKIRKDNETQEAIFETSKSEGIAKLKAEKSSLEKTVAEIELNLEAKKAELSGLVEPIFEKLPENLEIPEDVKQAHANFELLNTEITKQIGVNENNVKLREQYNREINELQNSLFTIGEQIAKLSTEISDYFSNLQGIVKSEFAGDIEIDVELLEYVLTKDEWKDCFKITANGKVFPYECNGALQNNLKLQVLATFQRLKNYTGITLMDNCEANTTQPINTCGLNCILAYATNDEELIIK